MEIIDFPTICNSIDYVQNDDNNTMNFNDLDKSSWRIWYREYNSDGLLNIILKSTNFCQKNMQPHIESFVFGLFLNLNISETAKVGKLIFSIHRNSTKQNNW